MERFIAILILSLPLFVSVLGVKLIRDTLFSILYKPFPNYPVQFVFAIIMFVLGIAFFAGFIYRRDLRRNKVKKKFFQDRSLRRK